jgi:hypothetical protein
MNNVPFGSNDVRLSPRQWAAAAVLIAALFWLIPATWERIEPLRTGPDYRVPYLLGNDYWNYARTCRRLAGEDAIVLVGDSVVWGHYVASDQTLSHHLSASAPAQNDMPRSGGMSAGKGFLEQSATEGTEGRDSIHDVDAANPLFPPVQYPIVRFVNLGLDGVHPAALCGLVEHYGGAIRGRRVILNCNLLWLSSPRHDLSTEKEFAFNHPGLVPQFSPRIPCYRASLSKKIGTVIGRNVSMLGWADHVRIAYFGGEDLASWTLEHPYTSPSEPVTLDLPSPDELPSPRPDARPWSVKGIVKQTPEWVDLDRSLQWRFFRRTVEVLQRRGNQVFVVVGPYNEHMLTEKGLRGYERLKEQVAAWLGEQGIPHDSPPALPSEEYADASHPTAAGYRRLARRLRDQEAFRQFCARAE